MDPAIPYKEILYNHPKHPSLLHIQKNNVKERRKNFESKLSTNEEQRRKSSNSPQIPPNKPCLKKLGSCEETKSLANEERQIKSSYSPKLPPNKPSLEKLISCDELVFSNNNINDESKFKINQGLDSSQSPHEDNILKKFNTDFNIARGNSDLNLFINNIKRDKKSNPTFKSNNNNSINVQEKALNVNICNASKILDIKTKLLDEEDETIKTSFLCNSKNNFLQKNGDIKLKDYEVNINTSQTDDYSHKSPIDLNNSINSPIYDKYNFFKKLDNLEQDKLSKNKFLIRRRNEEHKNESTNINSLPNTPQPNIDDNRFFLRKKSISSVNDTFKSQFPPLPPKPPRLLSSLIGESSTSNISDDIIPSNFCERLEDAISEVSNDTCSIYNSNLSKPALPPRITAKPRESNLPESWRTWLNHIPSDHHSFPSKMSEDDDIKYSYTQSLFDADSDTSSRRNYSRYGSSVSLFNTGASTPISYDQNDYAIPYTDDFYKTIKENVNTAYSILRRSTEFLNEKFDLEASYVNINNDVFQNDVQYYSEHDKKLEHLNLVQERTYVNVTKYEEIKLRLNVSLFEYALIVGLENNNNIFEPNVLLSYPAELNEKDLLASTFCFPDCDTLQPVTSFIRDMFSFVLTDSNGDRKYGYCQRYLPDGEGLRTIEAICIVSPIGETGLYEQLLDSVRKCRSISLKKAGQLLKSAQETKFPRPNKSVKLCLSNEDAEYTLQRITDNNFPNAQFGVLIHCLPINLIVQVFSSILLERKIIFFAEKLSTLSSCINAILTLLYPFNWQHTLVMTLPLSLYEIIESPVPYIVGILSKSQTHILNDYDLHEILIVDLNNRCFLRSINDEARILPRKLQKALIGSLVNVKAEQPGFPRITDVVVKEAFLQFFIETCGDYNECIKKDISGENIFDRNQFISMATSESIRMFLEWFTHTQMFQVFISERLKENNSSRSFEKRIEMHQVEMKKLASTSPASFGKKFIQKFKNYGSKVKKNIFKHSIV